MTDKGYVQNVIDGICAARVEAQKRGIEANMVLINDGLFFSKIKTDYDDIPIICGLKAVYSTELPDNILFAVAKGNNLPQTKNEQIANLQAKNERLHNKLKEIMRVIDPNYDEAEEKLKEREKE